MTEDSHVRDGIVRGWGHSEATVLQGSSWAHCSLTREVRALGLIVPTETSAHHQRLTTRHLRVCIASKGNEKKSELCNQRKYENV